MCWRWGSQAEEDKCEPRSGGEVGPSVSRKLSVSQDLVIITTALIFKSLPFTRPWCSRLDWMLPFNSHCSPVNWSVFLFYKAGSWGSAIK